MLFSFLKVTSGSHGLKNKFCFLIDVQVFYEWPLLVPGLLYLPYFCSSRPFLNSALSSVFYLGGQLLLIFKAQLRQYFLQGKYFMTSPHNWGTVVCLFHMAPESLKHTRILEFSRGTEILCL